MLDPHKVTRKAIPGPVFNQVRLAILRRPLPLRIELVRHAGLYIIIKENEWLAIDELTLDQVVLAWRKFETSERDALHEPVYSELSLYHSHAGLVMGSVLDELSEILSAEE